MKSQLRGVWAGSGGNEKKELARRKYLVQGMSGNFREGILPQQEWFLWNLRCGREGFPGNEKGERAWTGKIPANSL
jgi:hypothetical protein